MHDQRIADMADEALKTTREELVEWERRMVRMYDELHRISCLAWKRCTLPSGDRKEIANRLNEAQDKLRRSQFFNNVVVHDKGVK